MANTKKRMDKNRTVLKKGESQRENGTYAYRLQTADGKRHTLYAKTLNELREKEDEVSRDIQDGIKAETRQITVNQVFDVWCNLKRGIKDNTLQNYKYMYNTFVRQGFGKYKVSAVKKSDVKRWYSTKEMVKIAVPMQSTHRKQNPV